MSRRTLAIVDALGWPAAALWWVFSLGDRVGGAHGVALLLIGSYALYRLDWALDDGRDGHKRTLLGAVFGSSRPRGPYDFMTWMLLRLAIMLTAVSAFLTVLAYFTR